MFKSSLLSTLYILCAFAQLVCSRTPTQILRSPRITSWGDWGSMVYCNEGDFVVGVELKVEGQQGKGDDTGLNSVKLKCKSLTGHHYYDISSAEGPWGSYIGYQYCHGHRPAVGFEMKSEPRQGDGDDVAGSDFKLLCIDSDIGGHSWYDWGFWTGRQKCALGSAVCGIQTQVERPIGKGDDTSLNNVDIACCKVPNLAETCDPSYRWVTQKLCKPEETDCVARFDTGISYSGPDHTHFGHTVNKAYGFLVKTFENRFGSKIENRNVKELISDLNNQFTVEATFLDCNTAVESLLMDCGFYTIRTRMHRCKP